MKFNKIKRFLAGVLSLAMVLSSVPATGMSTVKAAGNGSLTSVQSAKADGNVVTLTFNDGIQGKVTILEDGIFRYNVDPSGEFDAYADVYKGYPDTAKIQQYPDDSDNYAKPAATVTEADGKIVITNEAGDTQIVFDKTTAKMSVQAGDKVVMQEEAALQLGKTTVQTLVETEGENFFGGGTQNGRFVHTGEVINIENESSWIDGGVASPSPFYYSTAGYGVLRNTYMDGSYDFGATADGIVTAAHKENEFDAYYFVSDADNNTAVVQELLQEYFHVTGNPVLLPQYAFYLGHLNAYNRDMWSADQNIGTKWTVKGNASHTSEGTTVYEQGGTGTELAAGMNVETLNGHGPTEFTENIPDGVSFSRDFSAQARIDQYLDYDIPFGFFLPNDGYGCGYGQNGYKVTDDSKAEERLAAVAANVANLKEFADYAKSKGVATGLWTQSNLTPDTAKKNEQWQLLRDFYSEVKAGVTTLKTDVAWVGYGYSFQLSGVKQAYDIVTTTEYEDGRANTRPNIISLDGWAGSQRYNSVWTGDQTGGNWEYIRFHIPTFIGQSLAGNPNIGCDMDGIWGGAPVIATRDYQWKSFAPQMLDMDGWGSYQKGPYVHGDPFTGISRMYLKMKAMLMSYTYTNAYAAANINTKNGDQGLPMVRAMFLEFPEDAAAYSDALVKYQYMWGKNLLVAPVYQDTNADDMGNDVRDGIYLPGGEDQIWIDYFTGDQYRGGQILNNFDAPIWKLPLFVKNGAIIPMFAENNSAYEIDRTQRLVEFWPEGSTEFNTIEDDGTYVENTLEEAGEYGTIDHVSYGDHVETLYTSVVKGTTATLTADKSTGTYPKYDQNKDTTFIVHASKEPTALTAKNGETALIENKVTSKEAFDAAEAAEGTFVSFYDANPAIETFASAEETEIAAMVADVETTGKLYVKFANTDAQANAQTLVIEGFENKADLAANEPNEALAAPVARDNDEAKTATTITIDWNAVEGAVSYQVEVDGSPLLYTVEDAGTTYTHVGLEFKSEHSYRVRAVNKDGYSAWSNTVTSITKDDPFLNTPVPEKIDWTGQVWGAHTADLAFDKIFQIGDGGFHSNYGGVGEKLTVDYGKAYLFDLIEYYPRTDAGNGTCTQMVIETSLDGVHWIRHGNAEDANGEKFFNWGTDDPAAMKTADLSDPITGASTIGARYLRFEKPKSDPYGNVWFAASEIKPYVVAGENTAGSVWKPFKVGNISTVGMADATVTTFQQMYARESSAHGSYKNSTWVGEIQNLYGDINFNGYSDVYDYAFTAFDVDGGTTKTGSVGGKVTLVPSKTKLTAGETFTVAVTAEDVENLNAYGSIMHYDPAKVEYVKVSYDNTSEMYTQGMTGNIVYDDGTAYVNHNAINMGDKKLINGSMVLSTVTMKAKQDLTLTKDVMDLTTVTIMGPDFSFIVCDENYVEDNTIQFAQDDFNITMTNEFLPTDDGTNVSKLIQQGSYDNLFNGNNAAERGFEFKWDNANNQVDGKLPEYITLPLTMHLDLKEDAYVDVVKVYNANEGNGYLTSAKAQLVYTDGTASDEIVIDTKSAVYEFNFTPEKAVDRIDVTFLTASGKTQAGTTNQMLTLAEIEVTGREYVAEAVDKTALNDAIAAAKALAAEDYTAPTWEDVMIALAAAEETAANEAATQEEVAAATETLNKALANLEDAVKTYKVKVEGGTMADGNTEGNFAYNTKLTVTAGKAPEGTVFAGWKVGEKVVSAAETYTFFVGSDLTVTAVYEENAMEVEAAALLQDINVTKRVDQKSDIRYLGQLVLPKDAKLVDAGLVWSNKGEEYIDKLDLNNVGETGVKATYIKSISNTWQFSVTIKGVPGGVSVPGKIFATYTLGGETYTVYSDAGTGTAK